MERNSSFGTSWADQWDYSNPDPVSERRSSGSSSASGKKSSVEKAKSVASMGFKKAKEGTTNGFHWIKDKCQKRTAQKN